MVYENGGGRFLIPYFIQLLLCGLPLFYMELALGQFHQTGLFTLWEKICPLLKGLAFTVMLINLFMAMFYNTVISWAVYYLLLSFSSEVPWKGCQNEWNTMCCFPINDLSKVSTVTNFTYNEDIYQRRSADGLIFHNQKGMGNLKRLLMFDTKYAKASKSHNSSQVISAISDYFGVRMNSSFIPVDNKNLTMFPQSSHEFKISRLVSSYYVLLNNEIHPAPMPSISKEDMAVYVHDSVRLSDLIEKGIRELYRNRSYELVIDCIETMNNPTQEFYSRHLTELHKSTGIENLGGIKWELVGCLFLVFVSVYFALWKGIKSAGKVGSQFFCFLVDVLCFPLYNLEIVTFSNIELILYFSDT